MKTGTIVAALLALTGCAAPVVKMTQSYNPEEGQYIHEKGEGSVTGQAFLRTRGGMIQTCAGYEAWLIPVTEYAKERMKVIYGSTTSGAKSVVKRFPPAPVAEDPDPKYMADARTTMCDATGSFAFREVLTGRSYFVGSTVVWERPAIDVLFGPSLTQDGGTVMQQIHVPDAEPVEVLLSGVPKE